MKAAMTACEYFEHCNFRKRTPFGMLLLKEYIRQFCYGGEDSISECQYRKALIKVEKLESKLESERTFVND